ncbi:MAG: glycerol-3-phosphate 1-O-acyltransferase PlsY [Deinococcales bacterium]
MNLNILWVAVVAYLFGAIPFGVLVARTYKIDVRKVGSGNTGAANVLRAAGWGAALVVALADIFKGGIPMLIAQALGMPGWEMALVGFFAIIGHNYSIFLGFRGGKGVATSYGTILLIDIGLGLTMLPIFIGTVAITRYSSAGSMIASLSGIVFAIAMQREWWKIVMLILIFALILWTHRDNLKRLATGTERQFNQRVKAEENS